MPKPTVLPQHMINDIYEYTDNGDPQDFIAWSLGITRWQVRNVLAERKAKEEAQEDLFLNPGDLYLLQVARATGLNAEQLEKLLSFPNMSDRNIFYWLSNLPPERLLAMVKHVVEVHPTMKQES